MSEIREVSYSLRSILWAEDLERIKGKIIHLICTSNTNTQDCRTKVRTWRYFKQTKLTASLKFSKTKSRTWKNLTSQWRVRIPNLVWTEFNPQNSRWWRLSLKMTACQQSKKRTTITRKMQGSTKTLMTSFQVNEHLNKY
jgi:hypothetical protein